MKMPFFIFISKWRRMEEGREGEGGGGRRWGGEGKWAAWQQRNVFNLSDPGLPAVYSILLYCKPINNTGQEELHGAEGETRNRYWPEVGIATLNRYWQEVGMATLNRC